MGWPVRVGMFDMSSLVKTDWNCQFSIQALAALDLYLGYTHQGISTNSNGQMVSMLLINLVHKCIHYMTAYLRIPPNKNNVLLPLFNYVPLLK